MNSPPYSGFSEDGLDVLVVVPEGDVDPQDAAASMITIKATHQKILTSLFKYTSFIVGPS